MARYDATKEQRLRMENPRVTCWEAGPVHASGRVSTARACASLEDVSDRLDRVSTDRAFALDNLGQVSKDRA